MEEKINKVLFWNKAATAGLALGAVSSAYLFIAQLFNPGIFANIALFILWFAKFVGCIWLMMYFMRSYTLADPAAERKHAFRFGALVAFLSALIFSAVTMADASFLHAEQYQTAADTVMQLQAETMPGANLSAVEMMLQKMPQYMFFGNLIIYTIYGTLLSLILSRSLISNDPFRNSGNDTRANDTDDQTDNQ